MVSAGHSDGNHHHLPAPRRRLAPDRRNALPAANRQTRLKAPACLVNSGPIPIRRSARSGSRRGHAGVDLTCEQHRSGIVQCGARAAVGLCHRRAGRPARRSVRGRCRCRCQVMARRSWWGGTAINATVLDSAGGFLVDRLVESPSRVAEGPAMAIEALAESFAGVLGIAGVSRNSVRAVGSDTPGPDSHGVRGFRRRGGCPALQGRRGGRNAQARRPIPASAARLRGRGVVSRRGAPCSPAQHACCARSPAARSLQPSSQGRQAAASSSSTLAPQDPEHAHC
jgi:hypothetical protein